LPGLSVAPTSTMLRGCSMAWMFLTISLASGAGDHFRTEPDAMLVGALILASIGVILIPDFLLVFFFSRNGRSAADHPFATCFPIYY
jgi:hypothetical protein